MGKVDFDDYSESYNELMRERLGFFEQDESYFARYKIEIVRRLLEGDPVRVLEYGCGIGRNICHIRTVFPRSSVYGCDVSKKSLEVARRDNPDAAFFLIGDSKAVEEFDLVILANVLHHVPPHKRTGLVHGLIPLLSSGGSLFVFEHNPFNPVTRKVVDSCPFDRDAVLLRPKEVSGLFQSSGFDVLRTGYYLFFPGFLRGARWIEKFLYWLPLGGQYYIKARKQ
jgi:SAM-dependent methyltransferase